MGFSTNSNILSNEVARPALFFYTPLITLETEWPDMVKGQQCNKLQAHGKLVRYGLFSAMSLKASCQTSSQVLGH